MSDSYQATYDAVRSCLRNTDVGAAIRDACHLDASHAIACLQQDFSLAAYEMARPAAIFKPTVSPDGGKWCALYGANLQEGVAGFGDTPAEAMADFDKNWNGQRLATQGPCGAPTPTGPCTRKAGHDDEHDTLPF